MKKIILTSLFISFVIGSVWSQKQLRNYVVIVRPVYHESTTKFLNDFSIRLKSEGYNYASDYLKVFADGKGFGSGFLVKGEDGKTYILTNRHVVMQAETAKIEFSNPDGSKVNYEGCKILQIDNENDLALLSFPDEALVTKAINLSDLTPEDGQEVFSAGFPGIAGKPSWQLGKGIVSNASFAMENIDSEIKLNAIQHTAQIDRGSSGGPLLIRDSTQSTGYSVLGMNTWKLTDRENVFLTIPTSTIRLFLNNALNSQSLNNSQMLENASQQFTSDIQHGYKKILKYISYNFIANISVEQFYYLLKKSSKEAKEDILDIFKNGHPIEAVRVAIADNICNSIEKNKTTFKFNSITGIPSYENSTTVNLSLNNKNVISDWIIEQNQWKIRKISSLQLSETEQTFGIAKDFHYSYNFSTELLIPTVKVEKIGYGAEFSAGDRTMIGAGIYKFSHLGYNSKYNSTTGNYDIINEGFFNYNEALVFIGYQLPLHIKKVYLIPFVKAGVGFKYDGITGLTGGISYGLKTGYKLKNNDFITSFLKIVPRTIESDFDMDFTDDYNGIYDPVKFTSISIGIGYSF